MSTAGLELRKGSFNPAALAYALPMHRLPPSPLQCVNLTQLMEQPEYLLKTLLSHVLPVAMDLRTLNSLNGTTIPTLYHNASFTVDVRPWAHARGIIGAGGQGRLRKDIRAA